MPKKVIAGGKKKKTSGKKKSTGKKRKLSSYNKFVKQFMAKQKGTGPATELIKKAAAEWRKLTDAEKKKY